MDTKSFIEKAKKVHGDKYDYSKTEYHGSHANVCVICHKHGEYFVSATNHLCGRTCPKCNKENETPKLIKSNFIRKALKRYNGKYNYSNIKYKDAKTSIAVICPKHGEFNVTPTHHLSGQECPFCKAEEGLSKRIEQYLQKLHKLYGNIYEYNFSKIRSPKEKIEVKCKLHGYFTVILQSHLYGKKCPVCQKIQEKSESISKKIIGREKYIKKGMFKWIRESSRLHNRKYDYSLVTVEKQSEKAYLICPIHGIFEQSMNAQLSGKGCCKCINRNLSNEERISNFRKVHGNYYDYSKMVYEKPTKKVCIICPKHGEFWITPNKHLSGRGCPICNKTILEFKIMKLFDECCIPYETGKHFDWLTYVGKMHLDFYLPGTNRCVECQGKQHIRYSQEDFGKSYTEDNFKLLVKRDIRKKELLDINNIEIMYYFQNNKFVEEAINNPMFGGIYTKQNCTSDLQKILEFVT